MGMRQVGKSTLLRRFAGSYHTFDDETFLRHFDAERSSILEEGGAPVVLDEIQKHPPAFDALKLSIDRKKRMGRFLVSGSVRFASRRQIRESLTGRIVTIEILPLGLSECHERRQNSLLGEIRTSDLGRLLETLRRRRGATPAERAHYLKTGGLPGLCFRRDSKVRQELFEQHLDTLLRRDIHLVRQMRLSFAQLRGIVSAVAARQGLPVNLSELARVAGCSVPTVKTALEALEGLFLVRPFGKSWFLEDVGLATHLAPPAESGSRIGMAREAYYELRLQHAIHLRHEAVMKPYTTRGGIDVPFLFEFKDGSRLAVLIDAGERPSEKSLKSVTWLGKRFSRLKALILTNGDNGRELTKGCASLPFGWIF
jgi:hypothetical protein